MFVAPASSQAAPGFGQGARAATFNVVIPAAGDICNVSLQGMAPGQALGTIATLYTDGSSPVPLVFRFPDTTQNTTVPAYTQGYWPVFSTSLQFQVSSPQLPGLGESVSIPVLAISVPVAQAQPITTYPQGNAGASLALGNPAGWNSFTAAVPGAGVIYNAVELDVLSYSQPVTISSTDIFGNAWSRTVSGFTDQEFPIPPTAAGTSVTATTAVPTTAGTTKAIVSSVWRVALAGIAATSSLPAAGSSFPLTVAASALPALLQLTLPAGFGGYVNSVQVFATGLSSATVPVTFELIDSTGSPPSGDIFWTGGFEGTNFNFASPVGWCSEQRGNDIGLQISAGSALTTGNVTLQIQWSPVPASQNG